MKRIWVDRNFPGLLRRREAEALLFERGLELIGRTLVAVASAPHLEAIGTDAIESVANFAMLDGDGQFYEETPVDSAQQPGVLEAHEPWDGVVWPNSDADAPDYRHVVDKSLKGATFNFGAEELELLIRANAFEPLRQYGRVIFGLRGAVLVASPEDPTPQTKQLDRNMLTLRDARPNHKDLVCVIGVYDLSTGRLSGFASSTVPNRKSVNSYYSGQGSGNMMPCGCYRLEVGWHLMSKPDRKIPGCLIENGRQKAVLRSPKNPWYDVEAIWEDNKLHGDNLHPAKSEVSAKFSSWGCLVVSGNYAVGNDANRANGEHTGEWALFRQALGLAQHGTGDHGKEFDVVVLTGLEAAVASDLTKRKAEHDATEVEKHLGRLRQGSRGERVERLQRALGTPASGIFDHRLTKMFADWQKAKLGWADGIYSPSMDAELGFNVFAPLPERSPNPPLLERACFEGLNGPQLEREFWLEGLYYEIGIESQLSGGLASVDDKRFESAHLEMSLADLSAMGRRIAERIQRAAQNLICGDAAEGMVDRNFIRRKIDEAASRGGGELRRYLSSVLTAYLVVPPTIADKVATLLFDGVLVPAGQTVGCLVTTQAHGIYESLCKGWATNVGTIATPDPPSGQPRSTIVPEPTRDTSGSIGLLGQLAQAASGDAPDVPGVRHYLHEMRRQIDKGVLKLNGADAARLVSVLCDSRVIEQLAGAVGCDPYHLMRQIEARSKERPVDKKALSGLLIELHGVLGDARLKVQADPVLRTLQALRSAKLFDEMSQLADRLLTRDPNMLGQVATSYAQGLIDSGRIVAGIEMLHAALDHGNLTSDMKAEANGILGRAHKQVYINHIRTQSDAAALREVYADQLNRSIASYSSSYDAARPGDNYYQGVNYIALLKRAARDRMPIKDTADADDLARRMIAALEPKATEAQDPWLLATLGEAHLALGQLEKAAEYMGLYSRHPAIDAFSLNGTVRQLQEVWQLKASADGAGAIVTGLKSALAQKENGFISLDANERRNLAKADRAEFQQYFETSIAGGNYVNFGVLKSIVRCGSAVAAVQRPHGQIGSTVGTGFLVGVVYLSPHLARDASYLLTNAHVLWDPSKGQGSERHALAPDVAQIVFENDLIDGKREIYACKRVVWQSPSGMHDATLIELDRFVHNVMPLELAPPERKLRVADERSSGTPLAIIGHPRGGNLALSVLGSLDEMQGTLIDEGPKGNSDDPVFLHYRTPTQPGNSGSPVLEAERWQVVGLHHAGFDESEGRAKLGGKAGRDRANEGIHINSIRGAINAALSPEKRKRRKWF
jgi:Trypsin-like peptidase domain